MSFSICSAHTLVQCTTKTYSGLPRFLKSSKGNIKNSILFLRKGAHTDHKLTWIEPKGYETGVTIYNSFSKSKVPFKTVNPGLVTWYSCGPTVYDSAHIGHALCYVRLDIIRRILQDVFNLNVVQVTGITDIDDKIMTRAKALNTSIQAVTQKYEKEFFQDMEKLNVLPSSVTPRVSEYIPQILSFVTKIMEKGLAYSIGKGTIYFDTGLYDRYGKLAKRNEEQLIQTIFDPRKKSMRDFALWKEAKEEDATSWDSPWGPGRPGWHIECSAMASHIFGETLDLHSGGMDLLFPHHENEEAQCCAFYTSDQWCNYWIHTGFLHVRGQTKMSKSLHNTITVKEFLEDHSVNAFRLLCLFSHYRTLIEYTTETMKSPLANLRKIKSFFQDSHEYINGSSFSGSLDDTLILQKFSEVQNRIRSSLADDFNTRQAMLSLLELISVCSKELTKSGKTVKVSRSVGVIAAVRGYTQQLLTVLGLKFEHELPVESDSASENKNFIRIVNSAVNFRQNVRNFALLKDDDKENHQNPLLSKDAVKKLKQERSPLLKACDTMRDEFCQAGIEVKDYSKAATWSFQKEEEFNARNKEKDGRF